MKIIFLALICLLTINSFSQKDTRSAKPRWTYAGIVQGGVVAGSSEINYSAQTIQGVKKGPWLLGIGAGIDNYVLPGFPVVAHGQWQYGRRKAKPFVYAQGGPQIPWAKNEWKDQIFEMDQYELKTGWLAESGIGYNFPLGKGLQLHSSLGYSIKQARYNEVQIPWSWWLSSRWPPAGGLMEPQDYYRQKLTMNRLVLKVGVQF